MKLSLQLSQEAYYLQFPACFCPGDAVMSCSVENPQEKQGFFVCFLFLMNMLLFKQQIPQMDSSADFLFVFLFIELFIGSMSQSGRRETVVSANFFPLRGHQVTILPASTPCNLPALFKHTLLCKHTHLHTLLLPHRYAHAKSYLGVCCVVYAQRVSAN